MFFFMTNFTTGFALHIQLFCIVTLTVNCPNEACLFNVKLF